MSGLTQINVLDNMMGPNVAKNSSNYYTRTAAVEKAVFGLSNENSHARQHAENKRRDNQKAAAAANLNARRKAFAAQKAVYSKFSKQEINKKAALEAKRAAALASQPKSLFGGKRSRKNRKGTRKQRKGCRKTRRGNRK
jgi:hypothetical protein